MSATARASGSARERLEKEAVMNLRLSHPGMDGVGSWSFPRASAARQARCAGPPPSRGGGSSTPAGTERVARLDAAGAQAGGEPALALLAGAVGEALGHDGAAGG